MHGRILEWPRAAKRAVVLVLDMGLAVVATWLAFSLRLDTPHWPTDAQWLVYAITPVLFVPIFVRFGLYRAIFRYTGQAALHATARAVALYAILLLGLLLSVQWLGVPRSLGVLQPLIFFLLIGASRAFARFWLAEMQRDGTAVTNRYLIFGAGAAGAQTAVALSEMPQFRLVGFIDDNATKVGAHIHGIPVFGVDAIPELVRQQRITDILLALPKVTRKRRQEIVDSLRAQPLHIRTLPDWADLASGRVAVQDFKELDIEDLLGRDPVPPDQELLARHLAGKCVWVTGAGGSIGSELCRQILVQRPKRLVLLDHSEFALYAIHMELQGRIKAQSLAVELTPILGSVLDGGAMDEIARTYQPETVYHAAAYKHVPLVEANPKAGVAVNVLGTHIVAQAAARSGAARFVLVSTDKAVRPTNVMGASKRMAEQVLQALAADAQSQTCFCMVRFGNVLGSSGSVVPLFRQQLAQGGPLTVTHPEVTRYFMTITEAAQLVLQAGAMAKGGEVFVLDMGDPVRILDLAQRMIELSGLTVRDAAHPQGDIAIAITGLRPGEKLYEELLIGRQATATLHPRIMQAREEHLSAADMQQALESLRIALETSDREALHALLARCVTGYHTEPHDSKPPTARAPCNPQP